MLSRVTHRFSNASLLEPGTLAGATWLPNYSFLVFWPTTPAASGPSGPGTLELVFLELSGEPGEEGHITEMGAERSKARERPRTFIPDRATKAGRGTHSRSSVF